MAVVHDVKVVHIADSPHKKWVVQADEMETKGDELYFLLANKNSSLTSLIASKCTRMPKPRPKHVQLSHFDGYKRLKDARNEANTLERSANDEADPSHACSLFGSQSPSPLKPRGAILKNIEDMDPMLAVKVHINDEEKLIYMLRPASKTSAVYIHADSDTIANAISFIREYGYSVDPHMYKERDHTLPKGVWRHRASKFIVKNTMSSKKNKVFGSVEEAQSYLADVSNGTACDQEGDPA